MPGKKGSGRSSSRSSGSRSAGRRTKKAPSRSTGGKRSSASRSRKATRSAPARTTRAPARRRGGSQRSGGSATDAVAVILHQHDETRKMFQHLAEAEGSDRRELFGRLADMLAAHARIEEQNVYPELARTEDLGALALDAVEEHLLVKRLLNDMLQENLDENVFDAKCRVLEVAVTRHIEEEESVMLPRARKLLGRERLEALGPELDRAFQELMQSEPRRNVAAEIDSAPALT